jgi:hypothetical protein
MHSSELNRGVAIPTTEDVLGYNVVAQAIDLLGELEFVHKVE